MSSPPSARAAASESPPIIVVGGGWSGIAAAARLVRGGRRVTLLDAAPQLGGRARSVEIDLAGCRLRLDNGQHLMVGAYAGCLALGHAVGASPSALRRLPMRLHASDGLYLAAARLPAPLHLLVAIGTARGLGVAERLGMARLLASARLRGWGVPPGIATVLDWLRAGRQSAALQQRFWEPLCIAMLNTVPGEACARTFLHTLRDTLGANRDAADFLLPEQSLDEVLPTPALAYLRAGKAEIGLRTAVSALSLDEDGAWRVHTSRGERRAHDVLLAVPPYAQARLLETLAPAAQALAIGARLRAFDHDAIATAYLAWPAALGSRLPTMLMLIEEPTLGGWGQWIFGRGIHQDLAVAAVVVSARGRLAADTAELLRGIGAQLTRQLGLPAPLDARVLTERRATFRCTPDRPRVSARAIDGQTLPWQGLWLAGDHAWADYPATLESAVRSGLAAADGVLLSQRAGRV
jgi:squalene-associated FAD-dependent desaturase